MSNKTPPVVQKTGVSAEELSTMVRALLSTPIKNGPVISLSKSDLSLIEFGKVNTTVMERALAQMGAQAIKGDVKSFEVLMKYSGLQPVEEKHVTIDHPVILDNVAESDECALVAATAIIDNVPEED